MSGFFSCHLGLKSIDNSLKTIFYFIDLLLKIEGNLRISVGRTCNNLQTGPGLRSQSGLSHQANQAPISQIRKSSSGFATSTVLGVAAAGAVGARRSSRRGGFAGRARAVPLQRNTRTLSDAKVVVCAGLTFPEGRKLRVAVVGGGPAGASAADALTQQGVETFLIERKLDNCKPCGGAIPLCMIDEFDLPKDIVDRQVRKMTMISPTNKEVQIGQTLKDDEYIGMVRREVLDDFLRQRAKKNGATLINGLFMGMTLPQNKDESYVLTYNDYEGDWLMDLMISTPLILDP